MTLLKKTLISAAVVTAFAATSMLPTLALAQSTAAANKGPIVKPVFPALRLADISNGERAIGNLGNRLPEVAAYYGKTVAEFARQLRTDKSAWIDKSGRLMFIEHGLATGLTARSSDLAPGGAIYPASQTFLLHSRPSAKRKIYLDFTGHTATGTAWNASYGIPTIVNPAFDTDNIPGTFSAAELNIVQNVWRRVAEDYAAFDVDVTTEEPPADQLSRTDMADQTYGTRVLITKNFTAGTTRGDCNCGGFAYVGIYDDMSEYYKPAYVFQDKLGNSEKNIAEAVTHEVGHNLGLSHDGTSTVGYYTGHGTGATGWAPIMGVGYSRELVQFSKGEYLDANNKEDDYEVMRTNGLPVALDDFGNTPASAMALTPTTAAGVSNFKVNGLVETPSDVDYFKFAAGAGNITVTAQPFDRSPNLDIVLQVRDSNGVVLAESNPVDALNGSLTVNLPTPDNYYVSVQGTGKGDPLGTGYSNYGSVGRYAIAVTAPAASVMPTAAITTSATSGPAPLTVSFSGSGSSDPGGAIVSYAWNFGDGSVPVSGVNATHTYTAPGTYSAALKVTNASGASDTRAVTISATPAPGQPVIFADSLSMSLVTVSTGTYAQAKVTVKDEAGRVIPGATVTGSWSGVVKAVRSATTNSYGAARVNSPPTKTPGTYTFAITNISATGYVYNPKLNRVRTDSITR